MAVVQTVHIINSYDASDIISSVLSVVDYLLVFGFGLAIGVVICYLKLKKGR